MVSGKRLSLIIVGAIGVIFLLQIWQWNRAKSLQDFTLMQPNEIKVKALIQAIDNGFGDKLSLRWELYMTYILLNKFEDAFNIARDMESELKYCYPCQLLALGATQNIEQGRALCEKGLQQRDSPAMLVKICMPFLKPEQKELEKKRLQERVPEINTSNW